jgi:hypothetical protein
MRVKIVILILGVLLFSGGLARATDITVAISGEVTSASGSALPGTIYTGVTFTGAYTYNTSTPDADPSPLVGMYYHNSPYGINLSLGGYEFKTATNHIGEFEVTILNASANWDYYTIRSNENIPVDGAVIEYILWTLGGPGSTISTTALPDSEPVVLAELTDWKTNVLEISGENLFIQGTVTQVELVPEPITGILMAIGVLFLRLRR